MALQLDEQRVPSVRADDFAALVKNQTQLLWGAVSQRSIWLPALFLFIWQVTRGPARARAPPDESREQS